MSRVEASHEQNGLLEIAPPYRVFSAVVTILFDGRTDLTEKASTPTHHNSSSAERLCLIVSPKIAL